MLTGPVIGQCLPRHRHVPDGDTGALMTSRVPPAPLVGGSRRLAVHMILDNDATHKHPDVNAWPASHPRFHLRFTPTSCPGSTSSIGGSGN